jgi:GntR family transcriptional regulator
VYIIIHTNTEKIVNSLNIELSEASGIPFYRQIVDQITHLIRSGQLLENQQLPSVRDLSRELLVSLIPVRRAYSDLEAARLIVRRQGYGTFVAEEVEMTSRKQAVRDARNRLTEAITYARQLGLADTEIRDFLYRLLEKGAEDDS